MELKFQYAIVLVGSVLLLAGTVSALANSGATAMELDFFETLAYGFTAAFFALFSGVLIGVGTALIASGLILGLRGNRMHIALAFLFSVLSLLVALFAIAKAESFSFLSIVIFFAGMASSGALLLTSVVFAFSAALRKYMLAPKAAPAPEPVRQTAQNAAKPKPARGNAGRARRGR